MQMGRRTSVALLRRVTKENTGDLAAARICLCLYLMQQANGVYTNGELAARLNVVCYCCLVSRTHCASKF